MVFSDEWLLFRVWHVAAPFTLNPIPMLSASTRLTRLLALGLALLLYACGPGDARTETAPDTELQPGLWVFVGTYTGKESKGIYRLDLDPATGALSEPTLVAEPANPSFLTLHPTQPYLYAVTENGDGNRGGALSAYAIEDGGSLRLLNTRDTRGANPCHVSMDSKGRYALVAHYSSGSVIVFPVGEDGQLQEASSQVQHEGGSQATDRQLDPHPHSIFLDAADRYAYVPDLGQDRVAVYRFDTGALQAVSEGRVAPGSGPRHFAFHPSLPVAYTNDELSLAVTVFARDSATGALSEIETVSTMPTGEWPGSSTAQIVVSPDGRFVYVSNRGHNSIATFAVDPVQGTLRLLGHQATGGETPRNFNLTPDGRLMVVANQNSDNLVVFRLDPETGLPSETGISVGVPTPVCVQFRTREE
ncbi:MAG: lactonase family protein [Bacteroidia bacterium]